MQEHGSSCSANDAIVSFYDAVLPMGIDSTERYRLILTGNISFLDIRIKYAIIHVDVVDLNSFGASESFKNLFAFECLCCSFAFLEEGIEKLTGMVNIKAEVFVSTIGHNAFSLPK